MVANINQIFNFKFSFKYLLAHLLICVIIYIVPVYALFIPIVAFLLLHFYFTKQPSNVLLLGAYSLCCKSEVVFYAFSVLLFFLFFFKGKAKTNNNYTQIRSKFRGVLLYLFVLYLIQLFNQGSVFSLPFFMLTFFSPVTILFYLLRTKITPSQCKLFFANLVYLTFAQSIITFVFQALPIGIFQILARPFAGDFLIGTTSSANLLAFLICTAVLPLLIYTYFKRKTINHQLVQNIAIVIFFVFMVVLNDGKARFYAFIVGIIGTLSISQIIKSKRLDVKVILLGLLLAGVIISLPYIYQLYDNVLVNYGDYITGKSNAKYEYLIDTFDIHTRSFLEYVFGTGAGTNGSRSANALAYDFLYKTEASVKLPDFIPPKTNEFTKRYLARLYTPEYALSTHERSAMLGNPFNSISALFVEFGIVGTLIFARFLYYLFYLFKNDGNIVAFSARVILIATLILSLLDQSFETSMIMYFFYLFIGLAISFREYNTSGTPVMTYRKNAPIAHGMNTV